MRRRSIGRGLRLTALLAFTSLGGCSLQFCLDDAFSRGADLRTGEIVGTALRPGRDEPAAFAQVTIRGTNFVRRTDSAGRFRFSGLQEGPWVVVVTEDLNSNGVPDRRRAVTTLLLEEPHRQALFSEEQPALAGVILPDVELEGTVRIGGQVLVQPSGGGAAQSPSELGLIAVVVAGGEVDVPRVSGGGEDPVLLGAEAKAGADATGTFSLPNVSGGDIYVLALLYESGATPGVPGRLVAAAPRETLHSISDESVDLAFTFPAPAAGQAGPRRTGQFRFSPRPKDSEQVYLSFVQPGREQPPCEPSPPNYEGTPFEGTLLTEALSAGSSVVFVDVPVGLWDVRACFTDSPPGDLFAQPIPLEDADSAPLLLGPLLLTDQQGCVPSRACEDDADCAADFLCNEERGRCELREPDSGWFDCDGDGRRGLPPLADLSDPRVSLWRECREACSVRPLGDESCTASDGNVYDCDDDGDGLADVFEDPACYGVGRGGDADGDGLCDGIDAWPRCRDNTAEACDALREDEPQVPELYLDDEVGEGEGEVGFDCGFERDATAETWCHLFGVPEVCSHLEVTCEYDQERNLASCTCCTSGECAAPAEVGSFPNPFACGEEDHQVLWSFCFAEGGTP